MEVQCVRYSNSGSYLLNIVAHFWQEESIGMSEIL